MSILEMEQRIRTAERVAFGRGASEEEIGAAERALGLTFPKNYRAFLRRFGWGGAEGLEVYGLGRDVPSYLDVVALTQSERTEMTPRLRDGLLPILNDGFGNHYCLDLTRVRGDDCPVVLWDHTQGAAEVPEEVSGSFVDWILAEIDERAADAADE